ncbi:MAG TPA: hypothetical protein DD381_04065 [Lentisphaeria bacterium]|nr:MAG: hypothetical protein A2X47_06565 [Lentisphaerae bacterium GWF2_38_69]HBM15506.1 hypothetical protein [Lentisphaeria bacterium]
MKHLVTDMGGVIIELYWEFYAAKMLQKEFTIEELQKLWITSDSTRNFETGKISFDEFADELIKEFNVSLSPEEIKKNFCSITGPPKPNFVELFSKLKKYYNLSVLSNTNEIHIDFLRQKYDLFKIFDRLFFSYEIGLMKPFPEIFKYVIKELNTVPENIFFFDDSKINVESAKNLGINAFVVTSPQEIYDISIKFI